MNKKEPKAKALLQPTPSKASMLPLVDSVFMIDKSLTAAKIRKTHLAKDGFFDPETDLFVEDATEFKEKLLKRIANYVEQHPAYPWFSRVRGIGKENIAKVIALINIEKAHTISGLWRFAGYGTDDKGHADRREKGEKLKFNMTLKVMCNRVGTALLKASALGTDPSHYGAFYAKEYTKYVERFTKEGKKIADFKDIPKDAKPGTYINSLHVHQMAFRKMIKLFLSHLWETWRTVENLPVRPPYTIAYQGHTTLIDPWEMVDRPLKKASKKKVA